MDVTLQWQQDMHFSSSARDLRVELDAKPDHGGKNLGQTPKELVLSAICGCTAMDVIAMLNKMRSAPESLKITANAEQTTTHPAHFTYVKLDFLLTGSLEAAKVMKAVEMSMTKYCGVSYMISRSCPISYQVHLNQQLIGEGVAKFE